MGRLLSDRARLRLAKGTLVVCLCKCQCSCLGKDLWVGSIASATCPFLHGQCLSDPGLKIEEGGGVSETPFWRLIEAESVKKAHRKVQGALRSFPDGDGE